MCIFVFFTRGMAGTESDKIFLEDSRHRSGNITCRCFGQLFHLSGIEHGFSHTDGFADAKRGHYCHDPWLGIFERVCNSTNFYCRGGDHCRDIGNEDGSPQF